MTQYHLTPAAVYDATVKEVTPYDDQFDNVCVDLHERKGDIFIHLHAPHGSVSVGQRVKVGFYKRKGRVSGLSLLLEGSGRYAIIP